MKKLFKLSLLFISIITLSSCKDDQLNIVFETDGGSLIVSMKINPDSTLVLPEDPVKNYQSFAGWYLDSSFETAFDVNMKIEENMVLYAKWEDITIAFEPNNESTIDPLTINFETGLTLPEDPVKPYLEFAGWYKDSSLETPFNENDQVTSDLTLYAKWDEIIIYFDTGDDEFMESWNYSQRYENFLIFRPYLPYQFFRGYEIDGVPFTSFDQLKNGVTLTATYEYFLDAIVGDHFGDEFFGINGFVAEYLFETGQQLDAYGNPVINENAVEPYEPFEAFIQSIGGFDQLTEERFIEFIADDIKLSSPSTYRNIATNEVILKDDFDETNVRFMDLANRTYYYDQDNDIYYFKTKYETVNHQLLDGYVEADFFTNKLNYDQILTSVDNFDVVVQGDKIVKFNNQYYMQVLYNNQKAYVNLITGDIVFYMNLYALVNLEGFLVEKNGILYDYYEGGLFYQGVYTPYQSTPFVDIFRKSMYNDFGMNWDIHYDNFYKLLVLITHEMNPEIYRNTNSPLLFQGHFPLIDMFREEPFSLERYVVYEREIGLK